MFRLGRHASLFSLAAEHLGINDSKRGFPKTFGTELSGQKEKYRNIHHCNYNQSCLQFKQLCI